MKHQVHETPKERLKRIMSYSLPYYRQASGPNNLIAVALLILLVAMLAIVIVAGTGAANLFRAYAEWFNNNIGR